MCIFTVKVMTYHTIMAVFLNKADMPVIKPNHSSNSLQPTQPPSHTAFTLCLHL